MKAVILCGGLGTRLRPLTYLTPKALIDIHGRTLTEHIFDLLKRHNTREVILAVGYLSEKIQRYFRRGGKFGMDISYVLEETPLGTAGPLLLAKEHLTDTFIVSNGDELKDIDITAMYKQHKETDALITIALTSVKDPSAYGVPRMSGTKISEFVEKPKIEEAPSNYINSGFYIMEPSVLNMIAPGRSMLETDVFPRIAKMNKLHGFPFSGQWFDTGTMERWDRAKKEWKGLNF